MDDTHVDALVRLHWLTEKEGGRKTIPTSKIYGTNMRFKKGGSLWSVVILLSKSATDEKRNQVAELAFLFPQNIDEKLAPGNQIFIYEGPKKLVAEGEIISVYE